MENMFFYQTMNTAEFLTRTTLYLGVSCINQPRKTNFFQIFLGKAYNKSIPPKSENLEHTHTGSFNQKRAICGLLYLIILI